MQELVSIENRDGRLVVSSRQIAEHFEKNHRDVLKAIDSLMAEVGSAQKFADLFMLGEYRNEQNKQVYREYLLTRDGFSLLVMGFNGSKALSWKLKYIEAFNQMEKQLSEPLTSTDLIIAAAQRLKAVESRQFAQEQQLQRLQQEQNMLKGKVDVLNDHEFTIMGYANLQSIPVTNKTANHLGRRAAKLSREQGYPIGSVTHPVYGRVNTYHVDVLDSVFDEA